MLTLFGMIFVVSKYVSYYSNIMSDNFSARSALLFLVVFWSCTSPVTESVPVDREVVFQTSTISTLLAGVYDGEMTFGALKEQGDFGIGTVDALDGEMAAVDGVFYQIKSDGKVYVLPDSVTTPFASVTFFDADTTFELSGAYSLPALTSYIDSILPSPNLLYAVKVQGSFDYVKTRSVPNRIGHTSPWCRWWQTNPPLSLRVLKVSWSGSVFLRMSPGSMCPDIISIFFLPTNRKGGISSKRLFLT